MANLGWEFNPPYANSLPALDEESLRAGSRLRPLFVEITGGSCYKGLARKAILKKLDELLKEGAA